MDTIKVGAAAVTGARHLRAARNGQDACATWARGDAAAVVVCDGCGSSASSEVGARLGASLVVRALAARIAGGAHVASTELWAAVRGDVLRALAAWLEHVPGDREAMIRDHFLFTIAAAAATRDEAAVWLVGDGAYAFDGVTTVVGPFAENQPPYLAYELLGDAQPAHFAVAARASSMVVATDGAAELELARFTARRFAEHRDALRRELALLARTGERVAWDERRVVRTPAPLQDDAAVGVILR